MDNELVELSRIWTTSKFHVLHGPRRAGKTLKMTHQICVYLIACVWINKLCEDLLGTSRLAKPLQVWNTYPVEFMYRPSSDGAIWKGANEPMLLKTQALDFHKFIGFDPEISWGFMGIDELNQRADRQQWQTGGQPVLMERIVQVGKSHLSVVSTVQSLAWINPRYIFQVDMTTGCRDAAWTGWGKSNGLKPGDLTFLYSKDISGCETGYMYEETGQIFESSFHGKWVQPFYNTDDVGDPWEHYETIKVKRRAYELTPQGKEEINSYPQDISVVEAVLSDFVKTGELKTKRSEYLREVMMRGCKMDKPEIVNYIIDCHNVRKYFSHGDVMLDFSKVTNLQVHAPRKSGPKKVRQPESGVGVANE